MTQKIGSTRNTNDEGTLSGPITVGNSVSVDLSAANERRTYYSITSLNQPVWIKFQLASVDNDKKGVLVQRNTTEIIFPGQDKDTGPISAIAQNGNALVYITEF